MAKEKRRWNLNGNLERKASELGLLTSSHALTQPSFNVNGRQRPHVAAEARPAIGQPPRDHQSQLRRNKPAQRRLRSGLTPATPHITPRQLTSDHDVDKIFSVYLS